jgi:peptidoglycan/LPS O-acetylase OafA/YrhL
VKHQDNYLIQLDGLRFIAVALVLWDHWMPEPHTLPFGKLGVNLFFVLSGFLIARILLSSKDKNYGKEGGLGDYLKKFYIRRTLRIFPIYYFSLLVLWLLHDPSVRGKEWWQILYASNIYISIKKTWLGVTDHFWSLAVEEQFYIFFPLLIFFIPRRYVVPFFGILIAFSVLLRAYFLKIDQPWYVSYVTMPTALDAFGFGALMAYSQLYHRPFFQKLFSNRLYLGLSFGALAVIFILSAQLTKAGASLKIKTYTSIFGSAFLPLYSLCFLLGELLLDIMAGLNGFWNTPLAIIWEKLATAFMSITTLFIIIITHQPITQ